MEGAGVDRDGKSGRFADRKSLVGLAVALALAVAGAAGGVRSCLEPQRETGLEESARDLEKLMRSELWLDAIDSLMSVMSAADTTDDNRL